MELDITQDTVTTFKQETTASALVEEYMRHYGQYAIREVIPNYIDGLKLVHRRILVAQEHNTEWVKGATLAGNTMQSYHPHADTGIYDAAIRLAQPFNQMIPLIAAEGNVGSYGGDAPAASRYLDLQLSEFTRDVYFRDTNSKTLTYVPTELNKGVEPLYLIPAIPMALLTGAQGIAFAYRSSIPYINITSLCDLVLKFVELKKKNMATYMTKYDEYAKYLVPDYPVNGLILNHDEYTDAISEGNFRHPLTTSGVMDVYPDKICIRTVPYGTDFSKKVTENFGNMFKSNTFITTHFNTLDNLSTGRIVGTYEMILKRGMDPFTVLDRVKQAAGFATSRTSIWNFTDHEGMLVTLNPIEIIEGWYNVRRKSVLADLKLKNVEYVRRLRQLAALVVVADNTDGVIRIIKTADNRPSANTKLSQRYKLSYMQSEYVTALPLHQLTKQGKDDILKQMEDIKGKLAELNVKFATVDETIMGQVAAIRDKYKVERRTKFNKFIAAIKIGKSGIIQAESMDELAHLLARWNNRDVEIIIYPEQRHKKHTVQAGAITSTPKHDLHKEVACDALMVIPHYAQRTVVIDPKDKTAYRADMIGPVTEPRLRVAYVNEVFSGLTYNNILVELKYSDFTKRRLPMSNGTKSEIAYVTSRHVGVGQQMVVITANTKDPNVINFELLSYGDKLKVGYVGTTKVLGIYAKNDTCGFTVPQEFLSRCNIKHLYFKSLATLMTENRVSIQLYRKQVSNGKTLVSTIRHGELWTIKN